MKYVWTDMEERCRLVQLLNSKSERCSTDHHLQKITGTKKGQLAYQRLNHE